jgi:hypothetical protein
MQEEDDKNEERCYTFKPEKNISQSQTENTFNNKEDIIISTPAAKQDPSPPKQEPAARPMEILGELINRKHAEGHSEKNGVGDKIRHDHELVCRD